MARTVRDANLEKREARRRLEARGKPYYRVMEEGVHLGYRRLKAGAGNWVVRSYVGDQKYEVETIGPADDLSDADGVKILSFSQAQAKARELMVDRAHKAAGKAGPLTVRAAVDAYIEFLEAKRKSAKFSRYAADAFILPVLGEIEAKDLTKDRIETWHHGLAKVGARIRVKKGDEQRFREVDDPEEHQRRRRSTANRILTVLKAALNKAWREEKVPSDAAWRAVEPFKGVDAARVRYLELAEVTRLLNASDADFRRLARGAVETGARYGELTRLKVVDFSHNSGTVSIRKSKSSKARHIHLTEDGVAFFRSITAGRAGTAFLFLKDNGQPWLKDHQKDPMRDACARAKIDPPMGFHGLRHTWASHAVMNGVPLMVVAKNLGHSDTRMVEKHYGHLAPSYVADAIRAGAPRFGVIEDGNVAPMQPVATAS
ncbi:tyrosine-type recombinase/integrase [Bradyrhizobium guangdongense]|uniref:Phage-related integrase n=1 Tax=Bradyrhizobium guangdongense TaxID=1325090 RepID=A0A410V6Z1_9BRAD|nr:site-specific integrase [Bradyrhizobium guangdongense]QAU39435.1 site-specific integrase [Bradyrhizobium guangdongense]QOZ60494.1 site-specific integrase [Bradyrhizobium guangdongense]GGI23769.1 phage-related integrase [Bradyrhizobium guangdongense]